jgi:hypothetical protein
MAMNLDMKMHVANPGVPLWWPSFCMAYDVTAAGILAWLLLKKDKGLKA